jgi:hypothetical protein
LLTPYLVLHSWFVDTLFLSSIGFRVFCKPIWSSEQSSKVGNLSLFVRVLHIRRLTLRCDRLLSLEGVKLLKAGFSLQTLQQADWVGYCSSLSYLLHWSLLTAFRKNFVVVIQQSYHAYNPSLVWKVVLQKFLRHSE